MNFITGLLDNNSAYAEKVYMCFEKSHTVYMKLCF